MDAANDEILNPGPDTITFAADVSEVTLTSDQLALSSDVAIVGPEGGITIARSSAEGTREFRIFDVRFSANAKLENLIITGGQEVDGGGISNDGILTITSSTISGNRATNEGGGIFNEGQLTVMSSTISENVAADFSQFGNP